MKAIVYYALCVCLFITSCSIKKTTFIGESINPENIHQEEMRTFGIEIPSSFETTEIYDKLMYDSLNKEIGFKTLKNLPAEVILELQIPDNGINKSSIKLQEYSDTPLQDNEKIFSCDFDAHAFYKNGNWNYSIVNSNEILLQGTIEVSTNLFTFSNTEKPSVFTIVGSYRGKPGDVFFIYFKCDSDQDNQVTLYYYDTKQMNHETKKSPLIPVVSAIPVNINGISSTQLTIGTDLQKGEYKFSIGNNNITLLLFNAWLGI